MNRQVVLSILFLSLFSTPSQADFSPSKAWNGIVACSIGCSMTVGGILGIFMTEELFGNCHDYNPVPWLSYGGSFVVAACGLSLMYRGFKKIIGVNKKNKKEVNPEDFDLFRRSD